ncbi:MAG: LamG domain-containing protein [Kiritimatiellae bacterium]|nr:LamG domain-containing protein [Kiritimatiellia bacterium]
MDAHCVGTKQSRHADVHQRRSGLDPQPYWTGRRGAQHPFTIAGIVARSSEGGNNGLFKGKLAEIRLWNRARNVGEISRDYRHRLSGFEQDLIGYWRLDDIDPFSVVNTVTHQKNMIPQGGHLAGVVEDTLALVPRAQRVWNNESVRFEVKGGQCYTSDVTLGANSSYTFEAWIRPGGYDDENRILGVYVAGQNGREIFELRKGKVGLYVHTTNGNAYPNGGDILPVWTWSHVAMSRSMSEVKFYVNGERVSTQSVSFNPTIQTPVTIGGAPGNPSFRGDIRDVRIWNGIRSDDDIATNYWRRLTGTEDGLLGYWPFDKNTGDVTTNLVTGTECRNTAAAVKWLNTLAIPELLDEPEEVIFGNRWVASFLSPYGSTYASTDLKLTDDFTLEAWIYPTGKATRNVIITQFNGNLDGRLFFSLNDMKLSIGIWDTSNESNTGSWITEPATVPLNQWTHVAATRAGSTVTLYRNGVAVKTVSNFVDSPILQSETIRIASREGPSTDSFSGSIAEVRIWNRACSGDEILRTMSHKLRGTESGLIGYFPLDEGTGSVMTNHVKNASNGTIHSMWSWMDLQLEDPLPPGGTVISIR